MINLDGVGFASPKWDPVRQAYYFPNGTIIRNQAGGSVAVDAATKSAYRESLKTQSTGLTLGGVGSGAAVAEPVPVVATMPAPAPAPAPVPVVDWFGQVAAAFGGLDMPGPSAEDDPSSPVNTAPVQAGAPWMVSTPAPTAATAAQPSNSNSAIMALLVAVGAFIL